MTSPPADQPARDRIHTDLDATLFVEAGAGTGKTRELIERLLRLVITGRAELRRIAASTFTEAAAAELRDRVRLRLEEAAQDEALLPEERDRCRAALDQVDAAAIETLHGFAQRILSEHPLEAGLPPLIEIQDDIRASIAFDERWAAFVDELLSDSSLEEALLRAFTLGLRLDDLRQAAWEFHQHWDRLEDCTIEVAPLPPVDVSPVLPLLGEACRLRQNCLDREDSLCRHLERMEAYRARLAAAATACCERRARACCRRCWPPCAASSWSTPTNAGATAGSSSTTCWCRPATCSAVTPLPGEMCGSSSLTSSSTSSRTPILSRSRSRRSSLARRPTAGLRPGMRRPSRTAASSSSATRSSPSTAFAAPTSVSTRGLSAASRSGRCG